MKKFVTLMASAFVAHSAFAADQTPLKLDVYNAGAGNFSVTSTLVYGQKDALLVDTGFTKADALRIAAKVLDSNKELTTIFISQADPDYYFGAETLHKIFPKAKILATPAVTEAIEKNVAGKVAFWGPQMGDNAPSKPIIPTAYKKATLTLEGHEIDIRGTKGVLASRPYLWIPENKAILGDVAVFGNIHLFMADAQSNAKQEAWKKELAEMLALKPKTVIPGHMTVNAPMNSQSIEFSLNYIKDFQQAKKDSKNSAELIKIMSEKYPTAQGQLNLDIAAKVHKGEMKW